MACRPKQNESFPEVIMTTRFTPKLLPLKDIDWEYLVAPIAVAHSALARYDGLLEGMPNPRLLLSPMMTQEAVLSSKIEGTQATLEEVLRFEAKPGITEREQDIREILNYRKAMSLAEGELKARPLCLNLIKGMHSVLLEGVRGRDKRAGEFRTVQNWVGRPNTPISEASYVPPEPSKVPEYMSNLEEYCHYQEKDRLFQVAVIHAQFELIHPFLDGNGRIGRILIPVFLYEKGVLNSPAFYLSAFLESTRGEYYSRLAAISHNGDWKGWIEYFLRAVELQARVDSQKATDIMALYNKMKRTVADATRSRFAIQALDFLFDRPIFNGSFFAAKSQIPRASAAIVLNKLLRAGIINRLEEPKGRSPAVYVFPSLLEIVQGQEGLSKNRTL